MIHLGKKNILGILVDAVDYEAAVHRIVESARERRGLSVTALAVHGVMTGVLDPVHASRLNALDLVTPDGQPVRWALNWLHGTGLKDRVYGPNLMLHVCRESARQNLPIYLYGSQLEVITRLQQNLLQRFPGLKIAGAEPSRFRQLTETEKLETIRRICESGAAITFVGLGCPRQEVWVYEYRDALSMPAIAVGAAFDFHAGNVPQAPHTFQRWGLEWLYRLSKEPRRLWKRYLKLNPLFLWLLLLQKCALKQYPVITASQPIPELRYG